MVTTNENYFLLASQRGIFKTTKSEIISHYLQEKVVTTLYHIRGPHYLVGLSNKLIVWNELTGQAFLTISEDHVFAIQRVLTTMNFIVKTESSLKVLTLPRDFNTSLKCSMMHLLDAKESFNYSHSLHH
jgi:hypothetical protein